MRVRILPVCELEAFVSQADDQRADDHVRNGACQRTTRDVEAVTDVALRAEGVLQLFHAHKVFDVILVLGVEDDQSDDQQRGSDSGKGGQRLVDRSLTAAGEKSQDVPDESDNRSNKAEDHGSYDNLVRGAQIHPPLLADVSSGK